MELKTQCFTHRSLRSNLDFSGTILEQNQDTNEKGGPWTVCLRHAEMYNIYHIFFHRFIDIISPKHGMNMYKL